MTSAVAEPRQGAVPPPSENEVAQLDRRQTEASAASFDRMRALADRDGRVRVIVGLQVAFAPEGDIGSGARHGQRAAIDRRTAAVREALEGTSHRVVHTYETVPFIALELSPGALRRLEAEGVAATLQRDTLSRPALEQTTPLVEATEAASVGRTGAGQNVAVLDTGVDKGHPFLQQAPGVSKVVSEACYSEGDCPGNVSESTAVGSGVPCTYAASRCAHGTHLAGIAGGTDATRSGVAPGAGIVAIQVFSQFTGANCTGTGEDPCALSFASDQIKALERVLAVRSTIPIGAVNLGVSAGQFISACDADARKVAIDNLSSFGIPTVVPSGNDGFASAVGAPGCISTAVTVGSTNDSDAVAAFSNSSSLVDFFAPGVSVVSSVPGGGFASLDGTSMASAQVAGAWAVARQVAPSATTAEVQAALEQTGTPVTDSLASPQITRDRIRVFSAAANLAHTGFMPTQFFGPLPGGGVASAGVGLARRTGGNQNPGSGPVTESLSLTGIPAGGVVQDAYLFWQSVGGPDATATFNGVSRTGTLVGGSGQFTCWNTNNGGAVRTYRFQVPPGELTGNGVYSIGGVGSPGGPDGQGASLVVIYQVPSSPLSGRVALRYGAMTMRPGMPAVSHEFTGLTVPSAPSNPALHVGIGDGEPLGDPTMVFAGSAITPVNFWSGAEGNYWDDERIGLDPSLLPAGTTARENSQGATGECLTWAYAALTYQYVAPPEPQPGPGGDTTRPTADGFAVGDATLAPGQGTSFTFSSSEAGIATLTVQKQVKGLKVRVRGRRRCVPQTRKRLRTLRRQAGSAREFRRLLRRRRCRAYKRIGRIRRAVQPGQNTIVFSGRIAGRRLRPGAYRALLVITDAAGNVSSVERVRFRVLRSP